MSPPPAPALELNRRVLVVDDDDVARREFCATLIDAGYEVAEAWSVVQAMRMLLSFRPRAVLLDLVLPDGYGTEVGRAMDAIVTTRHTCVVAVTNKPSSVSLEDPASFGARRVLLKPLTAADLLEAIGECFEHDTRPDAPAPAPVTLPPPDAA